MNTIEKIIFENNEVKENSYFTISNGPSKLDLLCSLAYAYSDQYHTVKFTLRVEPGPLSGIADFIIAGLEHEDGSGESFNLIAYAIYPNGRTHEYDCVRFKGYYDVKHRTGTLHRD